MRSAGRLGIVVCDTLQPELSALAPEFPEVVFLSLPARCACPSPGWDDLLRLLPDPESYDKIILLGTCCPDRSGDPPGFPGHLEVARLAHCFSPLLSDFAIASYQEEGGYLVSSGWLASWEERLAALGLDAASAPGLFTESVGGIIHLDTGVLEHAPARLEALARFVGRPHRTVPVGTDFLKLRIQALVGAWRASQREAAAGRLAEAARSRCADYALALDLLKLIVQTTGKEAVVREILKLYDMMFAASDLAYIPLNGDQAGPVTRIGSGSSRPDRDLQAEALLLDADFRVLPSGAGFLLRIVHEGSTLGVVSIDGIALPHNLEQYLHIARETVVVCAVVLNNALNFERIAAISDRLGRSEEALRESERLYHFMFEKSKAVQLLLDPREGDIVGANEAAQEFYGYPAGRLESMKMSSINCLSPPQLQEAMERAASGAALPFHFQHRLATGEVREVEVYSSPIQVCGRTLLHTIIHDITDRIRAEAAQRDLERRLQQAQKAQSLGRMAGAIAHKFNNLLGAVMGNLELASLGLPPGIRPLEHLADALKAASRAAEVSTLMLTYLGQLPGRRETLDLSEVCRRGLAALQSCLPAQVRFAAEFSSPGPAVSANEQQIQQMLASLVTNAWESHSNGQGTVRLTVRSAPAQEIQAENRFPLGWQPQLGQRYSCLEVTDDGCGIAEENVHELFDPFFSSKFTGRGLGLPIVLGVVRSHNGAVTVQSEVGRGSVFRVYLPQLGSSDSRRPAPAAPPELPAAGVTVLLVEDEMAVRKTTGAMLSRSGFRVLEARDGSEAIEVFKRHQDSIRCVLSDLTMPNMDGWETLAALRRLAPGIPAILSSGYDQSEVMAGDHAEWPQAFLRKPYGLARLLEAVRQALQAAPEAPAVQPAGQPTLAGHDDP